MKYLVAFIVLAISLGSVVFGVEWLQAPMPPMPASPFELRAAKPPAPPIVQQAVAKSEAKPESRAETKPAAKSAAAVPAGAPPSTMTSAAIQSVPTAPEPAPIMVPEQQPATAAAAVPVCDIAACERSYRTFTASDCTYQPAGEGPRRLCTRGTPPRLSKPDIRAQATCNIAACAAAYSSFDAADCTYQPAQGSRRLCER